MVAPAYCWGLTFCHKAGSSAEDFGKSAKASFKTRLVQFLSPVDRENQSRGTGRTLHAETLKHCDSSSEGLSLQT